MSFLKKIFGLSETTSEKNKTVDVKTDTFGISIKGIYKKSDSEIQIDFNVPSEKLFTLSIETDSFTKEKSIKFKQVASYVLDKLITWGDGDDFIRMNIGLRKINGQNLIIFSTYQKTLKFKKGDKIAFLFKDGEIKEYELLEKGYRVDQDDEGVVTESIANIDQEDLERFRTTNTDKWRHIPIDDRKPVTGTLGSELQNDILEMTRVYMYQIENPIE